MKVANLSDVKDDLSRYVEQVRRGGRVRILVHGVPAADLVPVESRGDSGQDDEAWLADLERRGLVRRGRGNIPRDLFRPGPRIRGEPLSETLLEERRSGR